VESYLFLLENKQLADLMSKYGKPIWQYVLEAAQSLKTNTFFPRDIIRQVHRTNPDIPDATIRSYVIAMAPNHSSSVHYPSTRKHHGFLDYLGDGRFKLKGNIEAGSEDEGEETDIEENLEETQISLESDLETFILKDLGSIESGLTCYEGEIGEQFSVDSGRIDILAKDAGDGFVVIELKAGKATDSVLAQVLSYMADVKKALAGKNKVRGFIIAYDFSGRLTSAVSMLENISLLKYKVKFDFEKAS
jgi:hypothetical protein